MALLDASNATTKIFNMADALLVRFNSAIVGGTPTSAQWRTLYDPPVGAGFPGERATLQVTGQNFTYDAGGKPVGGELTSLRFTLGQTGVPDTSVSFSSAVPLSITGLLGNGTIQQSAQLFWAALLRGDDTVRAPQQKNTGVTGDFFQVSSGVSLTGGNDTITANFTRDPTVAAPGIATTNGTGLVHGIVGDSFNVFGLTSKGVVVNGFLAGGADRIVMNGFAGHDAAGDAHTVGMFGILRGGNDTITSNAEGDPFKLEIERVVLNGDVTDAQAGSSVTGGRDTILGSDFSFYRDFIAGDAGAATATFVSGGNDEIDGRSGLDRIAGDVYVAEGGQTIGGNDQISGGEDSDLLAGDVLFATLKLGMSIISGNDVIDGGNGSDRIAGDVLSLTLDRISITLDCGDDVLSGGDGNDFLFGDFGTLAISESGVTGGNDRLDGGLGNDLLFGQDGIDTAVFSSLNLAVEVDLLAGTATGQGNDRLSGIENAVGSDLDDRLSGDVAANRLSGGGGNDRMDGRGGDDTIIGGPGADQLRGGGGADVFVFAQSGSGPGITDLILDFTDGTDKLDLSAFGFASFAAVQAQAADSPEGLSIGLPGGGRIAVSGLTLPVFDASDVII